MDKYIIYNNITLIRYCKNTPCSRHSSTDIHTLQSNLTHTYNLPTLPPYTYTFSTYLAAVMSVATIARIKALFMGSFG